MCAVEWKKLGDICEVGTGSNNREDACDNGLYPFYVRSKDVLRINKYLFDEEAIIIPGEGGIGDIFHYANGKYGLHQRAYRVHPINDEIVCKYLYYYLSDKFKQYIVSKSVGATATSIRKPMLEGFMLPIPSLAKQQEIVSHLDTFTTLISNLESELDMRRKQYEHYREVLFEENEECKVELGTFAQVEKAKNKKRITENAYSITQKGLVPTKEFFKEKTRVTSNDTSNYYIVQKNWFVYSPSRIDVGSINYLRDEGPAIVSPIDVVFSIDTNICNPHFLLNYLLSQDGMFQILKYRIGVEGTGRRSLPFTDFAKIQVPLPPKQTQQEIVEKLDAFENLIQSLEQEIKLRKQQYEYYREKLLTFE